MHDAPNAAPAYAAVDWGTSSFRLWLIGTDGAVLAERRSAEGMTVASGCGFPKILTAHLKAVAAPDDLPVIVCGMAGARQGWVEAGYVTLPAPIDAILDGAVRVPGEARDIRILPGLAQRPPGRPDVMRGEETQLYGSLDGDGGARLFCMPGTHSKWVAMEGRSVTGFSTFMTGELYDALSRHTILAHAMAGAGGMDMAAFAEAVQTVAAEPQALTSLLFTLRSGQLLAGLVADQAAARLSGLLIGAEIAGARARTPETRAATLIASGRLDGLYRAAFAALDMAVTPVDADEAVRRGLAAAAAALWFSA